MKKVIVFLSLLIGYPAFSACPIDINTDAVCTLPEFRQQISPIFKQSTGIQTNIDSPAGQLQPLNRADPINQMRGSNNKLNYSSGCQFGVCLQDPKESRLPENSDIGN